MMFQPITDNPSVYLPSTVDEVVELLFEDISLRDKVVMAQMSESELEASVYLVLAKIIRKEFGLYSGNKRLLRSCRSYLGGKYDNFEDPAMIIVKELWSRVKKGHNIRLVPRKSPRV